MAQEISLVTGVTEEQLTFTATTVIDVGTFTGEHLGVQHSQFHNTATRALLAAAEHCEGFTGVCLMPKQWKQTYDCIPETGVKLFRRKVLSVASVKQYGTETNDTSTLLDPSEYWLGPEGHLFVRTSFASMRTFRAFEVTYTAGLAPFASLSSPTNLEIAAVRAAIPHRWLQGILMLATMFFEARAGEGNEEVKYKEQISTYGGVPPVVRSMFETDTDWSL